MPRLTEVSVHSIITARSGYGYQFTPKHHGGDMASAQWLLSLTLDEEFGVFDLADARELSDEDGHLYGLLPDGTGGLSYVGSRKEQIAKFPRTRAGQPWHGYPLYPLSVDDETENRGGEKGRPSKEVFDRMLAAALITASQRRRLLKGNYA